MVYFPTFTIKINQMWVNIPYMDPVGYIYIYIFLEFPEVLFFEMVLLTIQYQ